MSAPRRLSRVVIRNYRSIGFCDLRLGDLTYLVGRNGSGKSNLLDALKFVKDALEVPLDNALNERGGIKQVRRQSGGRPRDFGIRLELMLSDGRPALYAFEIGAAEGGRHTIKEERCEIGKRGSGPSFVVSEGKLPVSGEQAFPAIVRGRLALASASGLEAFAPVFEQLTAMGFYNLAPEAIASLQSPQDGRLLKPSGGNLASVIGHLEEYRPGALERIVTYLGTVVPGLVGVKREQAGAGAAPPMSRPWKRPESVLVVVRTVAGDVLLLERISPAGFLQSVTGSLEPGEVPAEAARRELREETGIEAEPTDLGESTVFPIVEPWRVRYAPGTTHNREHRFELVLDARVTVRLCPDEHVRFAWLAADEALARASSSTNRDAIARGTERGTERRTGFEG